MMFIVLLGQIPKRVKLIQVRPRPFRHLRQRMKHILIVPGSHSDGNRSKGKKKDELRKQHSYQIRDKAKQDIGKQ